MIHLLVIGCCKCNRTQTHKNARQRRSLSSGKSSSSSSLPSSVLHISNYLLPKHLINDILDTKIFCRQHHLSFVFQGTRPRNIFESLSWWERANLVRGYFRTGIFQASLSKFCGKDHDGDLDKSIVKVRHQSSAETAI
jgi:hypothetical protein